MRLTRISGKNTLHDHIQLAALAVVSWGNVIGSIFGNQVIELFLGSFIVPDVGTEDGDCMATLVSDHFHSWDIGVTITYKNHALERDGTLSYWDPSVHSLIVPGVLNSLVNAE